LGEVYIKMGVFRKTEKFERSWEKFGQTQRSLFQNERSLRKTGSSLAKLREVTTVFFHFGRSLYKNESF